MLLTSGTVCSVHLIVAAELTLGSCVLGVALARSTAVVAIVALLDSG